jgi:hypothetical protein
VEPFNDAPLGDPFRLLNIADNDDRVHSFAFSLRLIDPVLLGSRPAAASFSEALVSIVQSMGTQSPRLNEFCLRLCQVYMQREQYQEVIATLLELSRLDIPVSSQIFAIALRASIMARSSIRDIVQALAMVPTHLRDTWHFNCLLLCSISPERLLDFQSVRRQMHSLAIQPNGTTAALVAVAYSQRGDDLTAQAILQDELSRPGSSNSELSAIASAALFTLASSDLHERVATTRRLLRNNPHRVQRIGARATASVAAMYLRAGNIFGASAACSELVPVVTPFLDSLGEPFQSIIDNYDLPDTRHMELILSNFCSEVRQLLPFLSPFDDFR